VDSYSTRFNNLDENYGKPRSNSIVRSNTKFFGEASLQPLNTNNLTLNKPTRSIRRVESKFLDNIPIENDDPPENSEKKRSYI